MWDILSLLKSEMKPSLGCTEPVAIGLAASRTRQMITGNPEKMILELSPNIFKNAFCVKIPNVGYPGVALAAVLGLVLSAPDNDMEIFSNITLDVVKKAQEYIDNNFITVKVKKDEKRFYIGVTLWNETCRVETMTFDSHDFMAKAVKNGEVLYDLTAQGEKTEGDAQKIDITKFTFDQLIQICETVPLSEIQFLKNAVDMNKSVSLMGFSNDFGLNLGKTIAKLEEAGIVKEDIVSYTRKMVASACDCRMGGGNAAVMTVLGSGNQGIEATLPVVSVAEYLDLPEERLLRAIMISVLITIYIKYHVGRLSPVCGATLSGAGAACAIAWLLGGTLSQMEGAVQNMIGNLVGMVCDGAKDGCALKLSNCAGEAVFSAELALHQCIIKETDGIISKRFEDTVKAVAKFSNVGMANVDNTLISILLEK